MYALEVLNPKLVVAGKVEGIGAQQYIVGDNKNPVFTKSATWLKHWKFGKNVIIPRTVGETI